MTAGKHKKIVAILLILTLCFIWGNSLMPATVSGAFSEWIKNILNVFAGSVGGDGLTGDGVLRKIAHASEFAVLGMELTYLLWDKLKAHFGTLVLCGLGTAFVDETIQLFSAGRAGMIQDVWIDCGGFATGVLILVAIKTFQNGRSS
ncbi:MAG: VanZ family protein [Oscillospiraceae bacterium]